MWRFSLGNQLRVGFFGPDASVQTDVSELPTVKLLSDHTAELIKVGYFSLYIACLYNNFVSPYNKCTCLLQNKDALYTIEKFIFSNNSNY